MKLILHITFVLDLVVASHAVGIRTEVLASKTGADTFCPNVEMVPTIGESGNGQAESKTVMTTVPIDSQFFGLGQPVADETFTGKKLPSSIRVQVRENDSDPSKNDGVCILTIDAPFSKKPITVKCEREGLNGRVQHHFSENSPGLVLFIDDDRWWTANRMCSDLGFQCAALVY